MSSCRRTRDVCTFLVCMEEMIPIAVLWYQISIPQAFIFQVHGGGLQQLPLVRRVTKNSLVRRGLRWV